MEMTTQGEQNQEDFFGGHHIRIKGDAFQQLGGPNAGKWGWKMNIFVKGAGSPIKMENGNTWFNTRDEAKASLTEHGQGVQKLMQEKAQDFFNGEDAKQPVKKERKTVNGVKEYFYYERLISDAFRSDLWNRIAKYARHDLRFRTLEHHLLDKKPEANIILISGMEGEPFTFEPSESPDLLDLPFPTCVIEATDKTLFNLDAPEMLAGSDDVEVLLVTRLEAGHYGFLAFLSDGNYTWACDKNSEAYKLFMTVAKHICNYINSKEVKVGQSKTNVRFKHKKSGVVKIKKLIHVSRHKNGTPVEPGGSFQVDWSHRWEVRGHFRKLPAETKVGKDQEGNYNVAGYTWVKAHSKGPEEKELVKKVREVT